MDKKHNESIKTLDYLNSKWPWVIQKMTCKLNGIYYNRWRWNYEINWIEFLLSYLGTVMEKLKHCRETDWEILI